MTGKYHKKAQDDNDMTNSREAELKQKIKELYEKADIEKYREEIISLEKELVKMTFNRIFFEDASGKKRE